MAGRAPEIVITGDHGRDAFPGSTGILPASSA